jgi:hypothetical protein
MKGISKCRECGKTFEWKRSRKQGAAKSCSVACSNRDLHLLGNKGRFKWSLASKEEKLNKIKENFESMVIKKEGCWDWKGAYTSGGYGQITAFHPKKQIRHHHASWIIHKGEIKPGLFVLHKCDNRRCSNPDHLYLGTHSENMRDMTEKKRQARGSRQGQAKLNELKVKEIKVKIKNGLSDLEIAKENSVTHTAIYLIRIGKNWKHIDLEE